ncbi:ribonuclease [Massilia dura]|uniref:Ribonuclease n=1 Tax=Pseudoduganella dura TaxID=321982 RepID=A0A6I3XKX0_9BURK|nr:ribonuclease T2 [Pseudoduganella dura]MUI15230.1 ribonuclease [Pseudoduganella dura]
MQQAISRTALLLAAAVLCSTAGAADRNRNVGEPGQFDYYALALSWSPSYCATNGGRDPNQCGSGRRLGFVLHGLWPQYENGYPQSCSREPLPPQVRRKYEAIYPSPKLIGHEWTKHGTCSGLAPEQYLALSAKLKDAVVVPAAYRAPEQPVRVTVAGFKDAFRAANPRLASDAIVPFCGGSGRFLREIRVCYRPDGASRSCGQAEIKRSQKSCGQPSFLLQSVR